MYNLNNNFLVLFSGDLTDESERSREVGLHKVPFFLSYNQPEPRYFNYYQNKKSRLYLCELIKAEFIPISQKKIHERVN